MTLKKIAGGVLICVLVTLLSVVALVFFSMERAHAATYKSSYKSSTYKSVKRASTAKKIKKAFERDDDVECSTLRNSRYAADREVYRRYC